jgi:hypothetical protein
MVTFKSQSSVIFKDQEVCLTTPTLVLNKMNSDVMNISFSLVLIKPWNFRDPGIEYREKYYLN